MQILNVIGTLGLLILFTRPTAFDHTILVNRLLGSLKAQNTMPSVTGISIKSVTLTAREENRPPVGVPPNQKRDIGFASVFLRIENSREENATLLIERIEIRNVSDDSIQIASQFPQSIRLQPLENSENAFYLTNKIGYSGQDKVKAVITYEVGTQVHVIESDPVDVERR